MIFTHALSHTQIENLLKGLAEAISMSKILEEIKADKLLSKLTHHIHQGYILKSASCLTSFQKIFEELIILDDGFIMQGDKINLPEALWHTAFSKAHLGGIQE